MTRLIRCLLLFFVALSAHAASFVFCQSTGASNLCSAGLNTSSAKVIIIHVGTTATFSTCPSASSPSISAGSFTLLTHYGTTSADGSGFCVITSASPNFATGSAQTFSTPANSWIGVFAFDTFQGAIESGSDQGGCFYSACNGTNVTNITMAAVTPAVTGDLVFGCVDEFAASDASIAMSVTSGGTFSTAFSLAEKLTGSSVLMDCWWGVYNSTSALTLKGTVAASFSATTHMVLIQAAAAAGISGRPLLISRKQDDISIGSF